MKDNSLGDLLREKLKENAISMRELSRLIGIDTAVISKIINGKRKANIHHLLTFSEYFDIPMSTLLTIAGYEKQQDKTNPSLAKIEDDVKHIQYLLHSFDVDHVDFSLKKVENTLQFYQKECEKDVVKKTIREQFKGKYEQVGHIGKNIVQLHNFYDAFIHRRGSTKQLLLMGSALLYFITTTDIIPDYFFSLGFLDDVIAIQFVAHILSGKNC